MLSSRNIALACAATGLCTLMLVGCGEEQPKKETKKELTVQEQLGREAAQNIQQPLDKARKAAEQAGQRANQLIDRATEATQETVNEAVKQADHVLGTTTDTPQKAAAEKSGDD